ncbi:MAG: hypothetical protein U9P14_06965 [Gemmatimonadota bacterium]|nr:hypothetical protein [Gemmatimonadota bacterium]
MGLRALSAFIMIMVWAATLPAPSLLYAQGAGPEDIYGGPGQNKNYCTPYYLYPPGTPEVTIDFEAWPDRDPKQFGYWTSQGNVQQYITADGAHYDTNTWSQGVSMIWPRGSAFRVMKSCMHFAYAIGEFNARAPKDTVVSGEGSWLTGGWGQPGRIPEDLSFRETGKLWELQGEPKVWVSSRKSDLADWPPEFCDESGDPVVIGDEDIVTIYSTNASKRYYKSNLEWVTYLYCEYQERVFTFSAAAARDIVFHMTRLVNKSRYHMYENMGPFDWEEFHFGPDLNAEIGQGGTQKVCWVDDIRLAFTYLESFSSPDLSRPTPLVGFTVLRSMPLGDGKEAPVASVSMPKPGGAWFIPEWEGTPTTVAEWWKVLTGASGHRDIQDPGPDYGNPNNSTIRAHCQLRRAEHRMDIIISCQ